MAFYNPSQIPILSPIPSDFPKSYSSCFLGSKKVNTLQMYRFENLLFPTRDLMFEDSMVSSIYFQQAEGDVLLFNTREGEYYKFEKFNFNKKS